MNKYTCIAGYTLAEMAIVMTIIAVVVGMSASAGMTQLEIARVGSSKANLEVIRDALEVYKKKRGYYPCPADPTKLPTEAEYGVAAADPGDCFTPVCPTNLTCVNNAVIGVVPFETLKVNIATAVDGWDRMITYVVDKSLTDPATPLVRYALGNLVVQDTDGQEVTASPILGDAMFVLISHGEDGGGAYLRDTGQQDVACDAAQADASNCDNADDIFVDSRLNNGDVVAEYFDDIVVWQAQEELNIDALTDDSSTCVASIEAGRYTTCAIDGNGVPYCWGDNINGHFGDGGTTGSTTPTVAHGGTTGWVSIAADTSSTRGHTCALRNDGTIFCAGYNTEGQLGDNTNTNSTTPVQESLTDTDWQLVKVGHRHSCAIKTGGSAFCWGDNDDGQLGDNSTTDRNSPTEVDGAHTDWDAITVGGTHTCGLRNNGVAYCWGDNTYGQLGDNSTTDSNIPVAVAGGGSNWIHIDANGDYTCALTQTGRAWCWGNSANGRLGTGAFEGSNLLEPNEVAGSHTNWSDISTGRASTCGIRSGRLYCWGNRAEHLVTDGGGTTGDEYSPVEDSNAWDDWQTITVNWENACGVRTDGSIYCWGLNDFGQVGDGTTTSRNTPTLVNTITACTS